MVKFHPVFVLFLLTLISCSPATKKEPIAVAPQCLVSQSQCALETQLGNIEVLFNQNKVLTEVPFSIYLKFSNDESVKKYKISQVKSYMEGKEMFMGKIPVFFSVAEKQNTWVAETLLGSCSEEQMIWRLWLEVKLDELVSSKSEIGDKKSVQKTFFIDFTSSRF